LSRFIAAASTGLSVVVAVFLVGMRHATMQHHAGGIEARPGCESRG
jgi:hypothetical protein